MTSNHKTKRRKKLIEVAIPLESINHSAESEMMPGIGAHPRGLHLWWARRPLSVSRAIIFCQLVDDPSDLLEEFPTEEAQSIERLRLFALVSKLASWKKSDSKIIFEKAHLEIQKSWDRCCNDNSSHPKAVDLYNPKKLPSFHDPFAGGGALPLEAQRLGLTSYASDLNPVAVLINKAMIEIPPKFVNKPAISQEKTNELIIPIEWKGVQGLAADIKFYGKKVFEETKKTIGHNFPNILINEQLAKGRSDLTQFIGNELPILTWLWVRTVKSPDPSFSTIDVPLATSFLICTKKGKEAYVDVIIENDNYSFNVKNKPPENLEKLKAGTKINRGNFRCILSNAPITPEYIRSQASEGNMGVKLMAIIVKGKNQRIYISPTSEQETIAINSIPFWKPNTEFDPQALGFRVGNYGMKFWSDIFTSRQLLALATFSEQINKLKPQIISDALLAGYKNDQKGLEEGGEGATAYADAIITYLSFALSRTADYNSTLTTWWSGGQQAKQTYKRAALPMTWDFPESNVMGNSSICWLNSIKYCSDNIQSLQTEICPQGVALQDDAAKQIISTSKVISTDPPYFDNIGYADLSDFFYVWLRKSLRNIYPKLFATLTTPKATELVATPCRHGGKEKARNFFVSGMTDAMNQLARYSHLSFPITIFYAFKQSESNTELGTTSTGWETFLSSLVNSGLAISGTWPLRTDSTNRVRSLGSNALATSVVLVCRKRSPDAKTISRKEFRNILREELPTSIKELKKINIAPVDLAQAAIGPGMSIYSNRKSVIKSDDSKMSVREALIEINSALDECLSMDESDFDAESRFALTFFESFRYTERPFSDAEGLAKARNLAVSGVVQAGILRATAGKVQLLRREDFIESWDPSKDNRLCVWEATQHLIKRLESNGEVSAAALLLDLKQLVGHNNLPEKCQSLAYRLYNFCEKVKLAEEARSYNGLIIAWPELERIATSQQSKSPIQTTLI